MSPGFVRAAVERRPFQPFIMHLADGRGLTVQSPEFIELPEEGRLVVVHHPTGATHVVDLLLVTDLEFPEP